jgi:hypothetical protein
MTPPNLGIYEALVHPYRRRLLLAMLKADDHGVAYPNPLEFAPVVQGAPGKSRRIAMAHNHLPKLAEMGIVRWDREAEELSKGPERDEIEPLLRWMAENRDELPEGWLPEGAIEYGGSGGADGTRSEP